MQVVGRRPAMGGRFVGTLACRRKHGGVFVALVLVLTAVWPMTWAGVEDEYDDPELELLPPDDGGGGGGEANSCRRRHLPR